MDFRKDSGKHIVQIPLITDETMSQYLWPRCRPPKLCRPKYHLEGFFFFLIMHSVKKD